MNRIIDIIIVIVSLPLVTAAAIVSGIFRLDDALIGIFAPHKKMAVLPVRVTERSVQVRSRRTFQA